MRAKNSSAIWIKLQIKTNRKGWGNVLKQIEKKKKKQQINKVFFYILSRLKHLCRQCFPLCWNLGDVCRTTSQPFFLPAKALGFPSNCPSDLGNKKNSSSVITPMQGVLGGILPQNLSQIALK